MSDMWEVKMPQFPKINLDDPYGFHKTYVRDREGTIWLLVHDGGMVTTVDYNGQVYSAGKQWLENNMGPLEVIEL